MVGASIAIILSITAFWTMPIFAGGAIFVGIFAALLAAYCARAGAPRASSVAMYYCIAASIPFWVSRGSTFHFQQGYLWLGLLGICFAVALFLVSRWNGSAT